MSKWTETELSALEQTITTPGMSGYHAFGALTNYSKSYNAYEVKRRRYALREFENQPLATEVGVATEIEAAFGIPEEFVGFNVGFWDIESTFSTQPIVLYAAIADQFGRIEEFRKGPSIVDDRELVAAYTDRLEQYDILVGWNTTLFDIPVIRGRNMFYGRQPLDPHMSIDLMYKASGSAARIGRRSLQSVSEYYDVANKKTPLNVRTWDKAMSGDEEAYELIVEHCNADVLVTRDTFNVLKRGIRNIHRLA